MDKRISVGQAVDFVKEGATVMVGGFMACGTPEALVDALVERGVQNLTLICNDTAFIDRGVGKLVMAKMLKEIITSHIGTNRETGRQMLEGETTVQLIPQGTLAERIRAAGYGLGGILTKTGLGTLVQEGKQVIHANGQDYLLELPLFADVALIYADTADTFGNLVFKGSARNFNPLMAAAAKVTIAQVRTLVPSGQLDPNHVVVPGALVHYLVVEEANNG